MRLSHLRDATFRVVCWDTRSAAWSEPRSPECRFIRAEWPISRSQAGRARLTARRALLRPGIRDCRVDRLAVETQGAPKTATCRRSGIRRPTSTRMPRRIHPDMTTPGRPLGRPGAGGVALVAASVDEAQATEHAADRPAAGTVGGTSRGSADTAVAARPVVFVRLARVATGARLDDGGPHRRGGRSDRWSLRLTRGRCGCGLPLRGDRRHPGGRSQNGRAGRVPTVRPSTTTGRTVRYRVPHEGSCPSSVGVAPRAAPHAMRWGHPLGSHQL
jgi:hypothetical protein